MLSPDVTARRNMAKNQCKSIAGAELCSSALGELVEPDHRLRIYAYGVVMLLAKKREKGRIPSLAISCFTNGEGKMRNQRLCKFNKPYLWCFLTFSSCECGDEEVAEYRESNDSCHHAFRKLVLESGFEEQSGHVETPFQKFTIIWDDT